MANDVKILRLKSDIFDQKYLLRSSNFTDLDDVAACRTNLGLVAGGAGDIWVEKAGDTMTGVLGIQVDSISALNIDQADGTAVFDVDTINRRIIVTSGTTGQSTIGAGLIVNNDSGSGAINDFQVNSDTLTALFVDASADTLAIGVNTTFAKEVLFSDKIKFTQVDGNEYIDSLADGYMDYRATTAHRFGDGTNYTEIKADGEINLHGTARTTETIWLNPGGIKAPGSKPATFIEYGLTGVWQFTDAIEANQESVSGTLKIPNDMDITVAPTFHIGWSANGISPGDCVWQLEYLWVANNEATNAAAQETLTVTATASATSEGFVFSTITGIDVPSATDKAMLWKITRLSANASDTIADTVELRGCALTRTINKLGTAT